MTECGMVIYLEKQHNSMGQPRLHLYGAVHCVRKILGTTYLRKNGFRTTKF